MHYSELQLMREFVQFYVSYNSYRKHCVNCPCSGSRQLHQQQLKWLTQVLWKLSLDLQQRLRSIMHLHSVVQLWTDCLAPQGKFLPQDEAKCQILWSNRQLSCGINLKNSNSEYWLLMLLSILPSLLTAIVNADCWWCDYTV